MTENTGIEASTYKGSLIGKRIRVRRGAGRHFEAVYGHRGFGVNDSFVVTADNEDIAKDGAETRVITFEDAYGRVATSIACGFVVIDAGDTLVGLPTVDGPP
jgi:hypothetical protein